jgi:plasmid maintenance system killer protein
MLWSTPIDIAWADRKLAKACASDGQGRRRWGPDQWKLLKRRLASLEAARTLEDMDGVPGRCHQLRADRRDEFAVTLLGSYRLVFVPDHDPTPTLPHGGIDRGRVTRILITEVVDYHGD